MIISGEWQDNLLEGVVNLDEGNILKDETRHIESVYCVRGMLSAPPEGSGIKVNSKKMNKLSPNNYIIEQENGYYHGDVFEFLYHGKGTQIFKNQKNEKVTY